jgi:hypothetical protein
MLGFFTTRWVDAHDPEDAIKKACDLVRNELRNRLLNSPANPPHLRVESVTEDELSKTIRGQVGAGFTWYPAEKGNT